MIKNTVERWQLATHVRSGEYRLFGATLRTFRENIEHDLREMDVSGGKPLIARVLIELVPGAAGGTPDITDATRWQFLHESQRNMLGGIHLLQLLLAGKGTRADYGKMVDRVIRSARTAGHTNL